MKIINLKINHLTNPLGFSFDTAVVSFVTCDTKAKEQKAAKIEVAYDREFNHVIYNSGKNIEIDSLGFALPIILKPRTRYYYRVTVWADNGEEATSEVAWFETAKKDELWQAKWITPDLDKNVHPELCKKFTIPTKSITSARAYVCGLGFYEININGKKCGDEYLTPNFNAYNKWLQYQTYDITDIVEKEENSIVITLGNGLYKGRFGFDSEENIYGDTFALLCEVVITFEDGTTAVIGSDESWFAKKSKILSSNIYDGEVYDASFDNNAIYKTKEIELGYDRLEARKSLPVVIKERIQPVEVIQTPLGETVLDMGQNMVGWVTFRTDAPKGTKIRLQYGELLQEGNFYRDNLRTAKAEFTYISDGTEAVARPHFTFYGFRYVKISGWPGKINVDDFTGCVLYSDMEVTGHIETSNSLVNRLFLNALWGQKGNFLDIPTDCPQRDERMGWTGDAQVFSGTACFNMDTYAFFSKYGYDLSREQEDRKGVVPMVVPATNLTGGGSSVWGDAATIIPWNVYVQYGDKQILEQQFNSMKAWVDHMRSEDQASGSTRLWTTGFHFGDWLALDGIDPNFPTGKTDIAFISSTYYYYSSSIIAKAAKVLGKTNIEQEYRELSEEIREAIRNKYFDENGCRIDTQTALILSLFMDFVPEGKREKTIEDLRTRLTKDNNHLNTGFVGTPYICKALSENGCNDLAYTLLLNQDYPSWLYAVTMGATTIWERWNSVLPDGKISGTQMNSLNHYAYGSIVEWMYRYMAGINPDETNPGFRHIQLTPKPDYRLTYVKASYHAAVGLCESHWEILEDGKLHYNFTIPFNTTASLRLPNAKLEGITVNGTLLKDTSLVTRQDKEDVYIELHSGSFSFVYDPAITYK